MADPTARLQPTDAAGPGDADRAVAGRDDAPSTPVAAPSTAAPTSADGDSSASSPATSPTPPRRWSGPPRRSSGPRPSWRARSSTRRGPRSMRHRGPRRRSRRRRARVPDLVPRRRRDRSLRRPAGAAPRGRRALRGLRGAEWCGRSATASVVGGPAIGQAAAIGLALTADRVAGTRPYARRATLRGAANAHDATLSPTHASLGWAVERVMDAYRAVGELEEDGTAIAAAMHAEADRDRRRDNRRPRAARRRGPRSRRMPCRGPERRAAPAPRPRPVRDAGRRPVRDGPRDRDRRPPRRARGPRRRAGGRGPASRGSRISCWELAAAGVPHVLVADAAAPSLIAAGEVDAVLVPADRVAANGDVAAIDRDLPDRRRRRSPRRAGPRLRAGRASIDPATPDGAVDRRSDSRPDGELERFGNVTARAARDGGPQSRPTTSRPPSS